MLTRQTLLAVLVLLAAACARETAPEVEPESAGWSRDAGRRDVAPAVPPEGGCGQPGARCCPGNLCAGGGCCVEGRCAGPGMDCRPLSGVCANGACGACGGANQPCCATGACTAVGTRCEAGRCVSCGHLGEACCPRSACLDPGTSCSSSVGGSSVGICIPCGEPGLRCCDGRCAGGGCCISERQSGDRCIAPGASCAPGEGVCRDGACNGCGGEGQPCCGGTRCEDPRTVCDPRGRRCTTECGAEGQACCRGRQPCDDGLGCLSEPMGGSSCRPCGAPGQPCCSSGLNACPGGGCCVASTCVAPGQPCRVGLVALGVCGGGTCNGCGGHGQPCCPSQLRLQNACGPLLIQTQPGQPPPVPAEELTCVTIDFDPDMPPPPGTPIQNMCSRCGGPGQPCCPFNRCNAGGCCAHAAPGDQGTCVADGESCPDGARCTTGACGTCGKASQKCCAGSCTAPLTTCRTFALAGELCAACGGRGEPCCYDQRLGANCASSQLSCRNGYCVER